MTELKLLMTPVGIIVLSAGVGNDVVGKYSFDKMLHAEHPG